jgi:hypothetical protein
MKVINLWGGPGAGKSTTRAGLFYAMKMKQLKVEEAVEFAKELSYEKNYVTLQDQWKVTGEQHRRINILRDQVDYAITDSPLPLGILYADGRYDADWYRDAVWGLFDSFDNINVYVERVKRYQPFGRNQTEDEARIKDRELRRLVGERIDLYVPGDELAVGRILTFLGVENHPKMPLAA